MDNEINKRRGLILTLVIATISIFVGLVWLITKYIPKGQTGLSNASLTPTVTRAVANCTYPLSYWMEHPELYPVQIVIGSKIYQANEIREALTQSGEAPGAQLQAELVGAFLNIIYGADQTLLETTIFQAYSWLVLHPDGSQVTDDDLETGSGYFLALEAFNLGQAGVPPCGGGYSIVYTRTPTNSVTATLILSPTPSETQTSTSSPTSQIITPIVTVAFPTQTRSPTTQPTGGQAPTATQGLFPTATKTPPPVAPPTFTQPPPPTATFTLPPLPTATFTLPPPP